MTWKDPIVAKVRKIRDAHAARFNYDLDAIYEDLKEFEKKSGLKYDLPPKKKPSIRKVAFL